MDVRFELRRQLTHMAIGLAIILIFQFTSISPFWLFVLALCSGLGFYFNKQIKHPALEWLLNNFERDNQRNKFPGKGFFFLLLGCFLTLIAFPRDAALAGICVLSFGDSVSTIIGKHLGKIRHHINGRKTWEGTLAGFAASAVATLFFVSPLEALLASFVGMGIELLEEFPRGNSVEDNLTIPFFSALALRILRL